MSNADFNTLSIVSDEPQRKRSQIGSRSNKEEVYPSGFGSEFHPLAGMGCDFGFGIGEGFGLSFSDLNVKSLASKAISTGKTALKAEAQKAITQAKGSAITVATKAAGTALDDPKLKALAEEKAKEAALKATEAQATSLVADVKAGKYNKQLMIGGIAAGLVLLLALYGGGKAIFGRK